MLRNAIWKKKRVIGMRYSLHPRAVCSEVEVEVRLELRLGSRSLRSKISGSKVEARIPLLKVEVRISGLKTLTLWRWKLKRNLKEISLLSCLQSRFFSKLAGGPKYWRTRSIYRLRGSGWFTPRRKVTIIVSRRICRWLRPATAQALVGKPWKLGSMEATTVSRQLC